MAAMSPFRRFLLAATIVFCTSTAIVSDASSPTVCVIGAGIASASLSHFLTKTPLQLSPRILVFERSAQVGGRIGTVDFPITADRTVKIESGASIIAGSNQLMRYFVQFLDLRATPPRHGTLGLWDGNSLVLRTSANSKMRDSISFVQRYGRALFRMRSFVNTLLSDYARIYPVGGPGAEWPPCETVQQLFEPCHGLYNRSQMAFSEVVEQLFSARLGSELIAAITRVNYGQDPGEMNGFSGAVGLAGSGADLWAVDGGNVQIVEQLLKLSKAEVLLNTKIESVMSTKVDGKNMLKLESERDSWLCDTVVLAAPYETADVKFPEALAKSLSVDREFQRTHATFVRGYLNSKTFGSDPPDAILTTEGVSEPFTSVGMVWHDVDGKEPPIFKVFSKTKLTAPSLARMFQRGSKKLAQFPWLAYPKFNVPERFPMFLHNLPGGNVIYTSPVESAGSAMEMSAVSGANAASLIKQKLRLVPEPAKEESAKDEL